MSVILPKRVFFSAVPGSSRVRLEAALIVFVDGQTFLIPSHSDADGNTIPWLFEWIMPRYGWSLEAGIVHDNLPRSVWSDTVHRKIATELGKRAGVWFPRTRAWIVWSVLAFTVVTGLRGLAIRIFGESK